MQVLLVVAPEGPHVGPKCRTCSLTGVAMDFALAITIIIARPFVDPMANSGMD
jgi:hypothetical protein